MSSTHVKHAAIAALAALAAPVSAFWRLPCNRALVTERADPIINPGEVSGHVHTIMGGNGFGFDMDYDDTQDSSCTTCLVTKDFSNYWVPTLYFQAENGSFISVDQVGGGTIYYLQRSDPADPNYDQGLLAFPEGFRMVAGTPTLRNYTDTVEQQAISFTCLGTDYAETNNLPNYNCPDGLRAQVFFPSCWNGVDLDSSDHKSHMSYPSVYNAGSCPPEFPNRTISIFYEVTWSVDPFADLWYGDSQPFVFSTGDPTGYGYHGDFINGWDVDTLQQAVDQCTNDSGVVQDCPVFEFFTDDETNNCWIPSSIDETVFGVLEALPGCNAIQAGPEPAVMSTNCAVQATISQPDWGFVDLTTSMGYEYIGCGSDIAGETRTLSSDSVTADNMTVEYCVSYCDAQGYTYAGLEYSTQCYCGNTVDSTRMPVAGYVGDCTMACAGDASEMCGGAAVISLYQKCASGSTCANIDYTANPSIDSGSDSSSSSGSSNAVSAASSLSSATSSAAAVAASSVEAVSSIASSSAAAVTSVSSAASASVSASGEKVIATSSPAETSSRSTSTSTSVVYTTQTVLPVAASSAKAETGGCEVATVTVTVPVSTVTVTAGSEAASSEALGNKAQGQSTTAASAAGASVVPSAPFSLGNSTLPVGTVASTGFATHLASGTGTGSASGKPLPTGHKAVHGHGHGHKRSF